MTVYNRNIIRISIELTKEKSSKNDRPYKKKEITSSKKQMHEKKNMHLIYRHETQNIFRNMSIEASLFPSRAV